MTSWWIDIPIIAYSGEKNNKKPGVGNRAFRYAQRRCGGNVQETMILSGRLPLEAMLST